MLFISFFEYVNRFRVEEAKRHLLEGNRESSTTTKLTYDVGFNNSASFYKAFKKFTDVNPTGYLKHTWAS